MLGPWRRRRVRVHLVGDLPSIDGYIRSRGRLEYLVEAPQLLTAAGAEPVELASRLVAVPRDRIAFYEVIG